MSPRHATHLSTFALCACVLLSFFALVAHAGEVVLDGLPVSRTDSDARTTRRMALAAPEREKSRVRIEREGDRFFWKTREGRELVHHVSGVFHYFVDPTGSGYVKVCEAKDLPPKDRPKQGRYVFFEHVGLGLTTITYWGVTETADLN